VGKKPARSDEAAQAAALEESGRGLHLLSLAVGLLAGGALYLVADRWISKSAATPALAIAVFHFIAASAAGWLLLAERRRFLAPIVPALLIALACAGLTYWIGSQQAGAAHGLSAFPALFWSAIGAPLSTFLAIALAKAALETGAPPRYDSLFFHGLTLPLIGAGAGWFAGLALILLYAWATLLKSLDVGLFERVFSQPWFFMPFLGAIGGLSIAMIRGQRGVLGALRYVLLLFSRIAMPIMALFSLTFLAVLATKGASAVFATPYPGGVMLALSFAGMLVFNGVYQNGQGGPPPLWLRLSTLAAIAAMPVYSGLAAYAFALRVGEYGLTPPRIAGLAVNALAFAYAIVCLAALASEARWKAPRWMAPVAPLNTLMAAAWVATLALLASPVVNMWAISARSQEARVATGAIAPEKFDFGYLKFELGPWGERALQRLAAFDGANATAIRAGASRALAAPTRWEYDNPEAAAEAAASEGGDAWDGAPDDAGPRSDGPRSDGPGSGGQGSAGPLDLPFNPQDAPERDVADDDDGR